MSNWGVYENIPSRQSSKCNSIRDSRKGKFSSDNKGEPPQVAEGGSDDSSCKANRNNLSGSTSRNGICTKTLSGGINRNIRAKSEKRELVDSWFSRSFANAGGLHKDNGNGGSENESENELQAEQHKLSFLERKKTFENLIDGSKNKSEGGGGNCKENGVDDPRPPPPSTPIPYRGSKTTPQVLDTTGFSNNTDTPLTSTKTTSSSGEKKLPEEWDFLTTLNDILRKENFLLGDEFYDSNSNPHRTQTNNNSVAPPFSCTQDTAGSTSFSNGVSSNVPLSPRPPRPARRADRRKDYTKARSMDIGQFCDYREMLSGNSSTNNCAPNVPLPPLPPTPPQMSTTVSSVAGNRCLSPYQNLFVSGVPISSAMNYNNAPAASQIPPMSQQSQPPMGNGRPMTPTNANIPTRNNIMPGGTPLSRSPLLNNMSSSLDSIYDRLKSTEYIDPIGPSRPFTQFYMGTPAASPNMNGNYYPNEFSMNGSYNSINNSSNYIGGGMGNSNPNLSYVPGAPSNNNMSSMGNSNLFFGASSNNYYPDGYSLRFQQPNHPNLHPRPYYTGSANNVNIGSGILPNQNYNPNSGLENQSWMMPDYRSRSYGSFKGSLVGLDYEDRLLRLESDKDTLHLQVSVLSDQIEAQTNKIQDLEKLLEDKRNVLETTEDQLQRELLTRSSLETQKLELMTEISSLRLKHASLERENIELKDRFGGKSTNDLTYIDGGGRIWDKPPLGPSGRASPGQSGIIDSSTSRGRLGSNSSDNGQLTMGQQPPTRVRTPPANAYRRIDQSAFGTLPRRSPHSSQLTTFNGGISGHSPEGQHKSSKSNSLSSGNINVVSNFSSLTNGSLHHHSTNANSLPFQQQFLLQHQQIQKIPSSFYPQKASGQQTGVGVVGGGASSVGVAYPPYGAYGYSSSTTTTADINPNSGNRSTSAPNLAAVERDDWERRNQGSNGGNIVNSKKSPSGGHKSRGIMRILGKLRRSNSGGLDNEIAPESGGPFTRGGLRATAAPRLGWMREPSPLRKPEGPISAWDSEGVVMWLNYLGLGMYAGEVKRWVKTGQQMLDASVHELEKELGIKNQLHRKKLSLAVHYLKNPDEEDNAGKLDYHWVIRWLDDVGLPQYKESFGEARIDGRILSHLTTEDLLTLKVTSVLHHASIKRGIQLLRIHKFHPGCLCRRGGPNPGSVNGNTNGSNGNNNGSSTESGSGSLWGPKHVATWTNHRVMEWLKAIDLAEYAPNLRGSGVHGALVILESRFNAELLATLLAIPGNKTLLRRHLSLQFNELVGRHIVQEKRLVEIAPDFVPIHPTTKVKTAKKSQFPLRKKRLSTEMTDELLCPVDLNVYPFNSDSMGQISVNENSVDGPAKGEGKVSNI